MLNTLAPALKLCVKCGQPYIVGQGCPHCRRQLERARYQSRRAPRVTAAPIDDATTHALFAQVRKMPLDSALEWGCYRLHYVELSTPILASRQYRLIDLRTCQIIGVQFVRSPRRLKEAQWLCAQVLRALNVQPAAVRTIDYKPLTKGAPVYRLPKLVVR